MKFIERKYSFGLCCIAIMALFIAFVLNQKVAVEDNLAGDIFDNIPYARLNCETIITTNSMCNRCGQTKIISSVLHQVTTEPHYIKFKFQPAITSNVLEINWCPWCGEVITIRKGE